MQKEIIFLIYGPLLTIAIPHFDPVTILQNILIPADAAVGTVIYRLAATDPTFDFPLVFSLTNNTNTAVKIDSLNCTRFNSVCQANVVLQRRLEIGRFYDFMVQVQNQKGETTIMNCSFQATNATTPIEKIFPGAPSLLMVSEKSRRNTELGKILAKGNYNRSRPVLLELWGSKEFGLHQKLINDRDAEGTIVLLSPLDYEIKTVHHIIIMANDPWTEMKEDTRNIAGWPLLIAVLDEQDTPPIFTLAPPTTNLSPTLQPGDLIVQVHAEDGDKGNPRKIRYDLISDGNPFIKFFNISENTGEIRLIRPLSELISISHPGHPILLSVIAEEIRSHPQEIASQSTVVKLAFIPPNISGSSPLFGSTEYNALLTENAEIGTALQLAQATITTEPGNVITLHLENNNNTFDIFPSVIEGQSMFNITVRDPKLLDYEKWKSVECYIVAKELHSNNFTARAKLNVFLININDNAPHFSKMLYEISIPEHSAIGTTVVRIDATDPDGSPDKIRYTRLIGDDADIFLLNASSGVITVSNSFSLDAEKQSTFNLQVEATDENGLGLSSTAEVQINLLDVNDNKPVCDRKYELIINSEKSGFLNEAIIKATDNDISAPNNEIYYEIIHPGLDINKKTGELRLTEPWKYDDIINVSVRVYDGGIPIQYSDCYVTIYPSDAVSRKFIFIVPGRNPDRSEILKTLKTLTGGEVQIDEIRPYNGYEAGATDVSQTSDIEKSVIVATIRYSKNSLIDVNQISRIFEKDSVSPSKNYNSFKSKENIRESSSDNLLWILLIILLLLLIIAAIALILCCICPACPFYIPPKRRKLHSSEITEKLLIKRSPQLHESKSVQVAEWFGRKEAWTPDATALDVDMDSLRRHEFERGSEKSELNKRTIYKQSNIQQEPSREQFYIREGNTDILRLVTRGGVIDSQRPITLIAEPTFLTTDSGKDILLKRFIDQQETEVEKSHNPLPNAVNRTQVDHELLEESLRQQNLLLRQILLEREKDLRLETQSLPAGTQTDQDIGTQTDPQYLRPPRRKVQSDNDASDNSDDEELAIIKARIRKRNGNKLKRKEIKRNIKTPIQEESEIESNEKSKITEKFSKEIYPSIRQTRTTELRQQHADSKRSVKKIKSALKKEILREISASLQESEITDNEQQYKEYLNDNFSEDSLDDSSPRSNKNNEFKHKQKYSSETDLRSASIRLQKPYKNLGVTKTDTKSKSNLDLRQIKSMNSKNSASGPKGSSRYMEWYNKKKENNATKKNIAESNSKSQNLNDSIIAIDKKRVKKTDKESTKIEGHPEHPLLQHSEHRFEAKYPTRRFDEESDSGIALTRPPKAEKKSIFTIAYNEMHTNQLRPDSSSAPI